jgi:hypothetical protein
MSARAPSFDDSLAAAAQQMRNLCDEGESLPSWLDAGSVGRMLVHVDNIGQSVTASEQDHVNAAKRLNDFAVTFARFAKNSEPHDGPLAVRLTSVSDNLREASAQLARAEVTPRSPVTG